MKVEVITEDKFSVDNLSRFYGFVTQDGLERDKFNLITDSYMFEISRSESDYRVTNAVDGWGVNAMECFTNSRVIFYL